MDVLDPIQSIVERLQATANTESVFGDPIEAGEKTIVPVAKVAYGFGGGFGSESDRSADEQGGLDGKIPETASDDVTTAEAEDETELEDDDEDDANKDRSGGSGGGGGGGVSVKPLGVFEVANDQTRFVPLRNRKRLLGVFLAGVLVGLLFKWRNCSK